MKFSVKSDYAARAVLWLSARYHDGEAHRVETMALDQGIPPNYLTQILIELKARQIVRSQRGKDGGYLLAKAPSDITFGEVLQCIHGEIFDAPALGDSHCPPELKAAWRNVQRAVTETATSITFQQLLDDRNNKETMYSI